MRKHIHSWGLAGAVATLMLAVSSSAFALPGYPSVHSPAPVNSSTDTPANTGTSSTGTGTGTPMPATSPSGQAGEHGGLAAAKLKSCQNRQNAITNIMARISDRGQKQLTLFSTIATRTEAFYTSKGVSLSNYSTLVADVNAKQTAAQTAVDAVKTAGTGFSCNSTDPTGSVASFQAALKTEITALQDYRTAVKNLIVGVKSVVGTTASSASNNSTTTNNGGNQ